MGALAGQGGAAMRLQQDQREALPVEERGESRLELITSSVAYLVIFCMHAHYITQLPYASEVYPQRKRFLLLVTQHCGSLLACTR